MVLIEVGRWEPVKCPKCGDFMFMFNLPLVDKERPGQYVVKRYAACARDGILYEVRD